MSEHCNNSACFSVGFWNASDMSVTFVFYNTVNRKKQSAQRQKRKKTAVGQALSHTLIYLAAVLRNQGRHPFLSSRRMTR